MAAGRKRGSKMSDMDPRTWSRQYQLALVLAIVIGMVLGGVVGLTARELQPPAVSAYDGITVGSITD